LAAEAGSTFDLIQGLNKDIDSWTGTLVMVLFASAGHARERIRIAIGTQDTTINTATGGPLVRELKLLEAYLPRDGQYKAVDYDIVWHNFTSGPPLNNELLANKLDIGQMADFPAILGATAFHKAQNGVKTLITQLPESIFKRLHF
jgi:NitT/TauT family transport system substrate-binding protein